ncbi:rhomboid family intramembrane serine protease [Natrinema halophilum]|uniref:rhomboid family intramembrane serine protease n=1 Tax=Natrinema halophilum TaxID=1699371 RepID=UPI001F1AF757|nr:rhomboid family intramembrane serine protease [Natrinema halophilum]UHQ96462.1 rhomboid family intramembrane serine protease [Natrinema halophilum]
MGRAVETSRQVGPDASESSANGFSIATNPVLQTLAVMATISIIGWGIQPTDPSSPAVFAASVPLQENWWQLITANYAHLNTAHFMSNALFVLIAGGIISFSTSATRFHLFFIVSGVITTAIQLQAVAVSDGGPVWIVGSSGAAFALCGYVIGSFANTAISGRASVSRTGLVTIMLIVAGLFTIRFSAEGSAFLSHFTGVGIGLLTGWSRVLRTS